MKQGIIWLAILLVVYFLASSVKLSHHNSANSEETSCKEKCFAQAKDYEYVYVNTVGIKRIQSGYSCTCKQ